MLLLIDPPTIAPIVPPLTFYENRAIRIGKTRVSLASVMYAYERGESAEMIQDSFPSLTLNEVYVTIAWMLENREFMADYRDEYERVTAEMEAKVEKQFSSKQFWADLMAQDVRA